MSEVEPGVNVVALTIGTIHTLTLFTGMLRFCAVHNVRVEPAGLIGAPKLTAVITFGRSAAARFIAEASVNDVVGMVAKIHTSIVVVATTAFDVIVIVCIRPGHACFKNCTPWAPDPMTVPAACAAVVTTIATLGFNAHVGLPTCRLPPWSNMQGFACALVM